ncbi:MAG: hypothetical protein Ta2E_11070 [Mycoplasmoidaceae bacterium]|nr:MAG: hypothetical protein Ta2E_11070 [Mycoplasmoidaceae bacterium]
MQENQEIRVEKMKKTKMRFGIKGIKPKNQKNSQRNQHKSSNWNGNRNRIIPRIRLKSSEDDENLDPEFPVIESLKTLKRKQTFISKNANP